MSATTIKIEGDLLDELQKAKPSSQSISAFVRQIIQQEIRRRKLIEAARQYQLFLNGNNEEQHWLEEWDSADLARAPTKRSR